MILVNWLTEKMIMICCFISRLFSSGIMKCYISGIICKIAIFWKSNCCIYGNMKKIATFWNSNCYFVGISKKLTLFYWKYCISSEIYKFTTFSISYVKLKLLNQLLQSQFNKLVSLDCLNLLIIFNFLDIYFLLL